MKSARVRNCVRAKRKIALRSLRRVLLFPCCFLVTPARRERRGNKLDGTEGARSCVYSPAVCVDVCVCMCSNGSGSSNSNSSSSSRSFAKLYIVHLDARHRSPLPLKFRKLQSSVSPADELFLLSSFRVYLLMAGLCLEGSLCLSQTDAMSDATRDGVQ